MSTDDSSKAQTSALNTVLDDFPGEEPLAHEGQEWHKSTTCKLSAAELMGEIMLMYNADCAHGLACVGARPLDPASGLPVIYWLRVTRVKYSETAVKGGRCATKSIVVAHHDLITRRKPIVAAHHENLQHLREDDLEILPQWRAGRQRHCWWRGRAG
jgi:hypothetical protein